MVLVCTILGCLLREIGGAIGSTVETALVAAGKVYGIYVAILAQGIGKVPKGLGVTRRNDAKAVVGSACKALRSTLPCREKRCGSSPLETRTNWRK